MNSDLDKLFRLNKSHVKRAGEMTARAYFDDPGISYFFPNPEKMKKNLHYIYDMPIKLSIIYGEVYAPTPNIEGIAGWQYHDGKFNTPVWGAIRSGVFSIVFKASGRKLRRLNRWTTYTMKVHKHHMNIPHWELVNLAVDPIHQGKGYASTLIRPMLARIDQEKLPCYLTTQNERNASMYQRYGFEVIEVVKIPKTDFEEHVMIRTPK